MHAKQTRRALLQKFRSRLESTRRVKFRAQRLQTEFSTRYPIANEQKMKNLTWQKQI